MRRKNLERAVVLGLLLSTSVYGSVFAAPPDPINDSTNDLLDSYGVSVTFSGDENTSAIYITNKDIGIVTTNPNNGTITLESGEYGIKLNGNANITLDSASDNIINVSLNKNTGINDHSDGIVVDSGTVNLIADNANKINAGKLGLSALGTNSVINLEGKTNEIVVNYNNIPREDGSVYALNVSNGGSININNGEEKADETVIRVTSNGYTGINAVNINNGGDIVINSDKISMSAYKTNNEYKNVASVQGIHLNNYSGYEVKSSVDLNSTNDIDVYVESVGAKADGIYLNNNSTANLTSDKGNVSITVKTGAPDADGGNVFGIRASNYSKINIQTGKDIIIDTNSNVEDKKDYGLNVSGISIEDSHATLTAEGILYINTKDINGSNTGIFTSKTNTSEKASKVNIITKGKNEDGIGVFINSEGKDSYAVQVMDSNIDISAQGDVVLNSSSWQNSRAINNTSSYAATETSSATINTNGNDIQLSAKTNTVDKSVTAYGIYNTAQASHDAKIELIGNNINIAAASENTNAYGIYVDSVMTGKSTVDLDAKDIVINANAGATSIGIYSVNAVADINADNSTFVNSNTYGLYVYDYDYPNNDTLYNNEARIDIDSGINNIVYGKNTGIYAVGEKAVADLTAEKGTNKVIADRYGVYAQKESNIDLTAKSNNNILAAKTTIVDEKTGNSINYGRQYAVYALTGSNVDLLAKGQNYLLGAVYANGTGKDAENKDVPTTVTLDSANNVVKSYAVIAGAGDLDQDKTGEMTNAKVISALYAEEGAAINVTGENYIGTYAVSDDPDLERVVWAYKDADINIDGATTIKTDNYAKATNSKDIAIAAGTAVNLDYGTVIKPVDLEDRATVNVNYENYSDNSISYISGDILSAYEGLVNINAKEGSNAGISIEGNLLAGNNGILNVDIGKSGILTGRADDYGDAGVVNNFEADEANEHQEFYNPAFSSTIYKGGRVDLGMGAGSKWYVTGQSWITTIDTSEAKGDTPEERATIDLVTEYKDKDGGDIAAHALTVYDFKGDADFLMNLSGNRADTDMLYMKHADGNYRIMLDEDITSTDINQDKEGNEYSGLRFATVGADSDVTFSVGSYDNGGAFNVEYEVGQDVYGSAETAHENEAYNGDKLTGGKPGDDMVDNFFGSDGKPVTDGSSNEGGISTASANGIMLMNEEVETFADEENNANKYNAINHKIVAIKDTELNDTGETILNMSRANYSNAIYMDRLNKRLGEARYINDDPEEDEGMWVRIRHDRIGKDDAYRSQNTMYELGYDKKQDCDNGERRVGFAIDYMHGDTGYSDIAGKGEIDRYGLWLYDTWMGDKGHYVDYVAKWGHLDNDFEVYTMRNGDKVTGDYSNNVFSVSAEYGRKKDIGNDWYFEPQAQLQLARVTGADYTTNQGTKVSVDGINSLIGRAGFRIGKDFGEEKQSTLYFKADVLHEFLGDQDVYVMDKSTDNKWAGISYDNEGTWYDIGIGYAAMMSKSSYAFIDLEQSFGNDNDDTYQINAGVRWTF